MTRHFVVIVDSKTSWDLIKTADQERVMDSGVAGVCYRMQVSLERARRTLDQWQNYGARKNLRFELRGHAWFGMRHSANASVTLRGTASTTPAAARAAGKRAADLCREFGLSAWQINAERDVWRGPKVKGVNAHVMYPQAHAVLRAFHAAFRATASVHGIAPELHYLGFARPSLYYRNVTFPGAVQGDFDALADMLYDAGMAVKRFELNAAAWPAGMSHQPYIGVGRLDKGVAVGSFASAEALARRAAALQWYFVHGSERQFVQGNPQHPSFVECMRRLRNS